MVSTTMLNMSQLNVVVAILCKVKPLSSKNSIGVNVRSIVSPTVASVDRGVSCRVLVYTAEGELAPVVT